MEGRVNGEESKEGIVAEGRVMERSIVKEGRLEMGGGTEGGRSRCHSRM